MKPGASLPSKLWVGSYEFALRVVPKGHAGLKADEDDKEPADGMTKAGEEDGDNAIYIASNLDARRRLDVIWHEVTHVINWANDIDEDVKPIEEEEIATKHGAAWTQFLLDNPRFFSWLDYHLKRLRKARKDGGEPEQPKDRNGTEQNPVG